MAGVQFPVEAFGFFYLSPVQKMLLGPPSFPYNVYSGALSLGSEYIGVSTLLKLEILPIKQPD
jgi:hypothetical protein